MVQYSVVLLCLSCALELLADGSEARVEQLQKELAAAKKELQAKWVHPYSALPPPPPPLPPRLPLFSISMQCLVPMHAGGCLLWPAG